MPQEDEALDGRVRHVPELVSAVDEAVPLINGYAEVEIGSFGGWIDALHDDGGVRLAVAKFG